MHSGYFLARRLLLNDDLVLVKRDVVFDVSSGALWVGVVPVQRG